MKLCIAGSRDLELTLDELTDIMVELKVVNGVTEVVSGGAKGIDALGEEWANKLHLKIKVFEAKWGSLGKKAGPLRNASMASYADEALVIMKKGGSVGSRSMIKEMQKLNKKVYIYEMEG